MPLGCRLLADLYVARSHDPFNTTDNLDGKLSGQLGINDRFGTTLVDRYRLPFSGASHDATYIVDPTDHAFDSCLSAHSHSEIDSACRSQRVAGHTSSTTNLYDRFYNQTAASLIRQLSERSTDVGSYWLTSWINAGRLRLLIKTAVPVCTASPLHCTQSR